MQNLKTRRTMALVLLLILAGAALFLLLGKGASSFLPGSNKPFVGNQAPDFTVMDLQNRSVTLSQLRGKPVLLNFWASWCPPCKEETPDLVKMATQFKGQIQFVGVNLTAQDNVSDLKAFVKQYGIDSG